MYLDADVAAIGARVGAVPTPAEGFEELLLHFAVLLRAKGTAVTAEDVHDAWSAWCVLRRPDHPALVPFAQLSPAARALDEPFAAAIRAAAGVSGGAARGTGPAPPGRTNGPPV